MHGAQNWLDSAIPFPSWIAFPRNSGMLLLSRELSPNCISECNSMYCISAPLVRKLHCYCSIYSFALLLVNLFLGSWDAISSPFPLFFFSSSSSFLPVIISVIASSSPIPYFPIWSELGPPPPATPQFPSLLSSLRLGRPLSRLGGLCWVGEIKWWMVSFSFLLSLSLSSFFSAVRKERCN